MRLVIGIVIGIFIIFNWGSIKDYFDQQLSKTEEVAIEPAKNNQDKAPKAPPQKNNEKADSFKDFK